MGKTVFKLSGDTLTVRPAGVLDSMTAPAFEEELCRRLPGVRHIIVDFEKVDYISSAGLRVLLALEKSLEDRDADLKLIHVNEQFMEIFELVGFLDVFTVSR